MILRTIRRDLAQLFREAVEQPRYRKKVNYADCNRHQPDKR